MLRTEAEETEGTTTQIEVFKCYISAIELYHKGEKVFTEANSFHLLDASDTTGLNLRLNTPEHLVFSEIRFQIGIDSTTNVAGAMGGDLDPSKGMYWTWQSGYINFKLEGTAPDCPARHHRFQFHIGGYAAPWSSLQTVQLAVRQNKDIGIRMSLDELLSQIDLKENFEVMSPGAKAVGIANMIGGIFSISK